MKNVVLLFFFLIGTGVGKGFAQPSPGTSGVQRNISGTMWEITEGDNTGISIPGATIRLLQAGDSSLVKGMQSARDGTFLFSGIDPGNYILVASFLGYTTTYTSIPAEQFRGGRTINLGKIVLKTSDTMLSEVVIEGQVAEVVVKEDTLEYNPAAFKMQDGAVVEDLLKRLPGVEVESDGGITATGRQVRRVYVDGKEFFGNDPRVATQNLTVEMLDKVQVIEKKSDEAILTGVDDGETETIINLTIKKNMNKGWMGNITAGAGALVDNPNGEGSRYVAQGTLMNFTENSQLSFIVNANNINRQAFTDRGNAVRSGSGDSGGGRSGGGGGGITNSNSFGINISTIVNEKLKIGGDVRYNYSETFAKRNSFRTNLLIDSVSYRESQSENQSYSNNIELNGKMEYKPDSFYTIVFSPRLSYNLSNSRGASFQETLAGDTDYTPVNRSDAVTRMKSNGLDLSGELTVTRSFARKGRRLSLNMTGNLNHSTGNGANLSNSEFFLQQNRNSYLNQESETSSNTNSYNIRVSYVEPLRENMTLQMYYNLRQNGTRNIRETYDYNAIDDTYSLLNTDYSKSIDNSFVNQTIGISLNSINPKYNYNIGVNIVPSYTKSVSFIKNGISQGVDSILNHIEGRRVVNYTPQINFTYRFNRENDLRFTYRGNTRQPSVTQLDPTPNVTNPLNIRSGNPDLLPSFVNNLSLRLNSSQRAKQRSLTATVDYSFTLNEIINYTEHEEGTGVQYTAPVNENGSWTTSGNILFSSPIGNSRRFKFSSNTRLNYNNQIGYTTVQKQSQRNISGTFGASENLSLSYSKNWFYGQLRTNARYSNTINSLEGKTDQRNANFGIAYDTQLTLPWNIGISSDINYRATRGLSEGYNKDEIIWNAGFSKQFLKGNRGSLRLEWTDILKQRLSISRNVTANYIEDSESNALTSYVLVSFAYRFNNLTGSGRNQSRNESQDRPQRSDRQDRQDWQGGSRDGDRSGGNRPSGGGGGGGGRFR